MGTGHLNSKEEHKAPIEYLGFYSGVKLLAICVCYIGVTIDDA